MELIYQHGINLLFLKFNNNDLGGLSFGQDSDGNYGYKKDGADSVIPFKKGGEGIVLICHGLAQKSVSMSTVYYPDTKYNSEYLDASYTINTNKTYFICKKSFSAKILCVMLSDTPYLYLNGYRETTLEADNFYTHNFNIGDTFFVTNSSYNYEYSFRLYIYIADSITHLISNV